MIQKHSYEILIFQSSCLLYPVVWFIVVSTGSALAQIWANWRQANSWTHAHLFSSRPLLKTTLLLPDNACWLGNVFCSLKPVVKKKIRQWWLVIWIPRNKIRRNINVNTTISPNTNVFENGYHFVRTLLSYWVMRIVCYGPQCKTVLYIPLHYRYWETYINH